MRQTARPSGLTLVELVVGLAMTAAVAVAVSAMLFATTRATASQDGIRTALVSGERATLRLDAAIRGSSKVLASGSNYLVLWMGEKQIDSQPQLNEICRIEWNSTAGTLTYYAAPANLASGNNTTYSVGTTDFNATTTAIKGTTSFPGTLWANQITGWTLSFDNATPTLVHLISYRVTITVSGKTGLAVGSAALRSQ